MTDERLGDALWQALERLPPGSGVIVRHYGLPLDERRALFGRIARVARRRHLVLLRAGPDRLGRFEDGVHNARGKRPGLLTRAVHDRREAIRAARDGVDAMFVSPVFATRSHPHARTLGRFGLARVRRGLGTPVIALGGMRPETVRRLAGFDIAGWAAIDWWAGQKRKAVPI
ncbi:thiamine phosphate synthase [Stakelama saccharophila]|uniref:Thiamine phosphate synthase n=1 Tax=Stakelama saccharophila TaxID=3075605 RepID=A0ABZ0B9Q2_9SPHN|nr:thiamine phosphate synthase [Stakelama sp. W311]WNO54019.1 thiamine phosphate synthase [Stakelama sp. W311]